LNGEGLQHEDGHSHILGNLIPNCVTYDPTYAYELTVIIQDGLHRMYNLKENKFYYITVMNENYHQPDMPVGCEAGIIKGMYLLKEIKSKAKKRVQLLGSGTILREVEAAAEILSEEFNIGADIWSATSFNELGRDAQDASRWNMLHPEAKPRQSYVEECFSDHAGPIVAATDYVKAFAEQIREFVPATYKVLGTDGYGRSDSRGKLREFFEVNRYYIVVAALKALAEDGTIKVSEVSRAIKKFNIDSDKPNPVHL
jgi:pyruvate dehydrogenase E1 component